MKDPREFQYMRHEEAIARLTERSLMQPSCDCEYVCLCGEPELVGEDDEAPEATR